MSNDLTYGQRVVLEGYFSNLRPRYAYNEKECILLPTCAVIDDLACSVLLDINAVADFMAEKGYCYHYIHSDDVSGWMFERPKGLDADEDECNEE